MWPNSKEATFCRFDEKVSGIISGSGGIKIIRHHNPDGDLPLFEVRFNLSEYNVLLKEMLFSEILKEVS